MGRDKLLLEKDGRSVLAGPASALQATCGECWIAGRSWQRLKRVREQVQDGGALTGLAAGLQVARQARLLLVPGDHPDLSPLLLAGLQDVAEAMDPDRGAVLVFDQQTEPLLSAWPTSLAPRVVAAVHAGKRSVLDMISQLDFQAWSPQEAGLDFATIRPSLRDLDTPQDWFEWTSAKAHPENL